MFRLTLLLLLAAAPAARAADTPVLWRDPGNIAAKSFHYGPGGRATVPAPPFRFLQEELGGTTPKVRVRDSRGRTWIVKFGPEAKGDTFAPRLAWAVGYFVAPVHHVKRGRIAYVKLGALRRAGEYLDRDGKFVGARFKLIDPKMKYLAGDGWHWTRNPFAGTRELSGLRMMMMLAENWDAKDARDAESNTAVFRTAGALRIYSVDDWGSSMGRSGNYFSREKWDCEKFREQSAGFVDRVGRGRASFAYGGKHEDDIADEIPVEHIRWLMKYLGRVTDAQIRSGLRASGANPHEVQCFTRSLRSRIKQMQSVARGSRPLVSAQRF